MRDNIARRLLQAIFLDWKFFHLTTHNILTSVACWTATYLHFSKFCPSFRCPNNKSFQNQGRAIRIWPPDQVLGPWTPRGLCPQTPLHCVSKIHQLWNGIAQDYKDQFWWIWQKYSEDYVCFYFHVGLLFYQLFVFQTGHRNNTNFDAVSSKRGNFDAIQ